MSDPMCTCMHLYFIASMHTRIIQSMPLPLMNAHIIPPQEQKRHAPKISNPDGQEAHI